MQEDISPEMWMNGVKAESAILRKDWPEVSRFCGLVLGSPPIDREFEAATESIYPVWAPSDRIMVSIRHGGVDLRLFEVDPNGAQIREAAEFEPGDTEPIWTPDGSKVEFGRDGALAVTDITTSQVRLLRTESIAIQWAISPDNQSIAYAAQETGSVLASVMHC